MKRYYLDCEFDGFHGPLLSMALSGEDEWYECLVNPIRDIWAINNVVIDKRPLCLYDFQQSLYQFLAKHDEVEIVADWPDDIRHFCESLIVGTGSAINTPKIHFVLDRSIKIKSVHHALHDARLLKVSQQP